MTNPLDTSAASAPNAQAASAEATGSSEPKVRWGAVVLFVLLAYGLAWLVTLPLWLSAGERNSMLNTLCVVAMMFTPGVAAMATLLVTRTPAKGQRLRSLGVWPLRPAKRTVLMALLALALPFVIAIIALAIAALCGWLTLDLTHLSGFQETLQASYQQLPPEQREAALASMPDPWVLVIIQLVMVPIGAIINMIPTTGEELGWRGWLLPALRPLGTWPALLLSGVIWGLWHTPVTLLGHNYGLYDWRGVALMTVNCVLWGVLAGWFRLRTASLWPSVALHGSLNAAGGLPLLFIAAGTEFQPWLALVVGVSGWIVLVAVLVVLGISGQFKKQPELDSRQQSAQQSNPGA